MDWRNDRDGNGSAVWKARVVIDGEYLIERMQRDDGVVYYCISWNNKPVASTRSLASAKVTVKTDCRDRAVGE